jgi:hypothetical protein
METKMATQQQNGSAVTKTSTKNDGGSIVKAGAVNPSLANAVSVSSPSVGVFGSTVVPDTVTANDYATKSVSAKVFAKNNQQPQGMKLTDPLKSGALVPGLIRSIHKLEVLKTRRLTTAIRAGHWNIYTGQFTTPPTVATDTLATDEAATPTRAVPGELVYKTGASVPVQDDYKSKTN